MGASDLSPDQHAVAELILAKGRTHDEIAELLDLPRERVEQLAREAADQLGIGAGSQAEEVHGVATGETERQEEREREEHAEANRRTAPMFALYLVMIALGIAAAVAIGFVRDSDDPDAGTTVEQFTAAYERKDGASACEELTTDARNQLESDEREPCEQAILSLELSGGAVTQVDVAETDASVDLAEGERAYLDKTTEGWRISALGCKPQPSDAPDDCELEA